MGAGTPLVVFATVFAWRRVLRAGVVSVGLLAFTTALGVGLTLYLTHTGDCTEYPPGRHLGCGWVMFAGAALCSAELHWRGGEGGIVGGVLCLAVLVFVLKPFADIAFAGC